MRTNRNRELARFWLLAKQISKEHCYDVVESMYGHRSLRLLTLDELTSVVAEILRKSGITLESRKKKAKKPGITRAFIKAAGYTLDISEAQEKLIMTLFDKSGTSKSHFLQIIEHVAPEHFIGSLQAGKIIGALQEFMGREKKPSKPIQAKNAPAAKTATGKTGKGKPVKKAAASAPTSTSITNPSPSRWPVDQAYFYYEKEGHA